MIAATNRDLAKEVQKQRFRQDLYYRLNVYPIEIPPLRARKEDIALLAEVFLREATTRLGRPFEAVPPEVIEALKGYGWPGNVRELQNLIERAVVTSSGPVIKLPEEWEWNSSDERVTVMPGAADDGFPVRHATLDELERAHIVQVLRQTNWRIEGPRGAAAILCLNPSTLRSRMQKLAIHRPIAAKVT